MAKESMKAREVKRKKLVDKYAVKRAACKSFRKMHHLCAFTIVVSLPTCVTLEFHA